MLPQDVSAQSIPTFTASYGSDDLFYLENNRIKSHYHGMVQIVTHVIGAPDNSSNRLWIVIGGGNINPNVIAYGAYATADNVQIAEVDTTFNYYVQFVEAFKIGAGGTGSGYIFITILD